MKRLVKRWWKVLPCILIVSPLVACGGEPVVGTVVEKVYDDPDFYMQPIMSCNKTCTTTYMPATDPERYLLKIEQDSDGEIKTVRVDPFTWKSAYVGDAYREMADTR